jgi:hypothetical protein
VRGAIRRFVSDDPARQVASGRIIGARLGAEYSGEVESAVAPELEDTLDRPTKVVRTNERAVRIPEVGPQLEGIRPSGVGRPGDRLGKIWNQRAPVDPTYPFERDQTVVGQAQKVP